MRKQLFSMLIIVAFGMFISGQIAEAAAPTVTAGNISIDGASGIGGEYIIDDTVFVEWDNSADGDNNTGVITGVTVNFSQFGGGAAITAFDDGGTDSDSCDDTADDDIWIACEDVPAGAIDGVSGKDVLVTATNGDGSTTQEDDENATVDNVAPADPVVSDYTNPINATNVDNFSFNGTTDPSETVYYDINDEGSGVISGNGAANGSGIFTFSGIDVSSLADGEVYLYVWVTDAAGNSSASEFTDITINKDAVANTPTASPVGGTYTSTQSVTLSTTTSGATIYYTTNGDTPTAGSTEYVGAISISETTTVKAVAAKTGLTNSGIMSTTYKIDDDKKGTKAERTKYKHYKAIYKNKASKSVYLEIKNVKKTNKLEFDKMKAIFIAHKHDNKAVFDKLDAKTKELFLKYKKYNGYRNYKIYKEKTGN